MKTINTINKTCKNCFYRNTLLTTVFLLFIISISLNACQSDTSHNKVHDKHFWMKAHVSVGKEPVSWKPPRVHFEAYFGKYHEFADHFQSYYGDPIGPITGLWKVTRYLGEKPILLDCGEEPKYPDGTKEDSLERSHFLAKIWEKKREKFYECLGKNEQIKQNTEQHKYYFARSTNNYIPIIPPRGKRHVLYEAHISFGPMGNIPERALHDEYKVIKDQLFSTTCHNQRETCYRLLGKESNLYYTVRSNLLKAKVRDGVVSAHLAVPELIKTEQRKWHEIQGIEISQQQYVYLKEHCFHPFDCFIDNDMPNITPALKAYQKATAWDMDNNEIAIDAFIKKAKGYRAHPQQDQAREVIPTEKERNPF